MARPISKKEALRSVAHTLHQIADAIENDEIEVVSIEIDRKREDGMERTVLTLEYPVGVPREPSPRKDLSS